MTIRILVDHRREIGLIQFSGVVRREEIGVISRLYLDRDFYRFTDKELVQFTPDASLAGIDVEDIGLLADSYVEAVRRRGDQQPILSAWVMSNQVRIEARMWWDFTRDHVQMRSARFLVETIEAALSALGLPQDWAEDVRAGRGFRTFGDDTTISA